MENNRTGNRPGPTRREFVKAAAVGTLAALPRPARPAGRPNVLLFIVDQMRLPRWFPPHARIPNYERLAARGVAFDNHFVSAVPCSPSRACLFTGLHMDANRIEANVTVKGSESLDPQIPTLGHLFRQAGYRTPYFGKLHLTRNQPGDARNLEPYGFDWLTGEIGSGTTGDRPRARAAISWLEQNGRAQPWFMTLSLLNPHDICSYPSPTTPDALIPNVFDTLPPNFNDDLAGKPACQRQYRQVVEHARTHFRDPAAWLRNLDYYYAMTLRVDKLLGQVLDTLHRTGLDQNTLVIFTSDHGDMAGSHQLRLKGPFPYLENANVPLVVSWPGQLPEGARTDALSQNVDIFPTLAALIGANIDDRKLPGQDLNPILADPSRPGAEHALFSFTANIVMLTRAQATGGPTITAPQHIRAIRTKDAVFARYFDPGSDVREYELYDLKTDPLEMVNLAGDAARANLRKEMEERLREAEEREMRGGR